jgi:hypothetical protein
MTLDRANRLEDIEQWLVNTALRAGIADSAPRLVDTWNSRTATLHHFTWDRPSSADVVVKVHSRREEAAAHFTSMCQVAYALDGLPVRDFATLTPLGFSADLGAVLMPYAAGRRMSELVQNGQWASSVFRNELLKHFNGCGRSLARFHGARPSTTDEARQMAQHHLNTRISRVLGHEVDTTRLPVFDFASQSYGDFHIGHIIVTNTNQLVLLDPPIQVRYEYCYRDIGLFAYTLFMNLIHPRALWRHPSRIRYRQRLFDAFLVGYTSETDRPFTASDIFYINACEAFFLNRRMSDIPGRIRHDALLAFHLVPLRRRLRELREDMLLLMQQVE